MNIAVISDIHGFTPALTAVLDDIERTPGIDRIIAAGDLCEGGPDPSGALDLLERRGIVSVQGNTDRDLATGARSSPSARWVMEQLGETRLQRLAALPFELRVAPPGDHQLHDDLLVVHANPFDQNRPIPPDASDLQLEELLDNTRAGVIAFGHIHIAYQREWNGIQLLNVSAVGNPKDGDLRSKWGLCRWNNTSNTWTTELHYVDYPLLETLSLMRQSGMPNWRKASTRLQNATYDV